MKKIIFLSPYALLLSLVVAGLYFTSCSKVEKLLTFKIKNETSFVVPSAIGINTPYSVPVPDIQTNATQAFANNNTDINKVKDIKLEALNLTITSPAGFTFRPIKTIRIFISAQGLEEKLIAYKEDIPTTVGNTIALDCNSQNVDMYVKQPSYNLRTETILREAFFQDVEIKAQMTFKVSADL